MRYKNKVELQYAEQLLKNSLLVAQEKTESAARSFHVRKLEAFGSVVRDDFDPEHSDIDLLVEIDQQTSSSYFDNYFGLRESLESLFNLPVDLISTQSLSNPYFIQKIADERRLLYAA